MQINSQTILSIAVLLVGVISFIFSLKIYFKIKRMIDFLKMSTFHTNKMVDSISNIENQSEDINHNFRTTYSHISKLSDNVSSYLNKEQVRRESEFIMPKPDLAAVIDQTIKEQIIIEATLSKNMRIPSGDLLDKIIVNVKKTYPNVDEEYLSKKVLVRVEEFNETAVNK